VGEATREIVEHPGAVAIVAVDGEDRVVLVRQRRESARRELLELPAGTIEAGEEPLAPARRELAEETGLRGGRWHEVTAFWSSPGFLRERITLFLAEGLEEGESAPASDERVELVRWPVGELPRRLEAIEDAKTLIGLLWLVHKRGV
jgi:ADP-ribose pyrophosphatase